MKLNSIHKRLDFCFVGVLLFGAVSIAGAQDELFNPEWSIALDEFGYSDWAYDQRPGFAGREYLSGEWAAAISYSRDGMAEASRWLNPNFWYPDWVSYSDFGVELYNSWLPGTNQYGFKILRSVIANGAVRIGQKAEMIDTTNGIPQGLASRSSAAGTSVKSSRYVLRQTFSVTNISGTTLTNLSFFKFLHALQANRVVYDDHDYGPVFNGHRYTITEQGPDYVESSLWPLPVVHWDTVALHANVAPSAWEVGRYGIEGIDSHAVGKPGVGVHMSVESGVLSNVDSFGPTNLWVSGAVQCELGALAPNASTNIEFLMSLGTVTTVKSYKVVAWGDNRTGQATVPPAALSNVVQIAAGAAHSLALRSDGRVVAWGDNHFGQTAVPSALSNVVYVAAGARHSLAVRSDGKVFAWGDNTAGQVTVPEDVTGVSTVAGGDNHSMALMVDEAFPYWGGWPTGWGSDAFGQLEFSDLSDVMKLAAGSNFTLALDWDGNIFARGDNSFGQLNVPYMDYPEDIAAGAHHALAVDWDGWVVGWGSDADGQLDVPWGLDARAVAAGGQHSLALQYDGSIVGWGNNSYHQVEIPTGLWPAASIAAGGNHSLAMVPVPPELCITRAGEMNIVAWSAAWSPDLEYVQLQETTSLSGGSWRRVEAEGAIEGAEYRVRLPFEPGQKFYRLLLQL